MPVSNVCSPRPGSYRDDIWHDRQ